MCFVMFLALTGHHVFCDVPSLDRTSLCHRQLPGELVPG